MKSAVETLNPTRVKLTVEVSYDELKPSMDAAYKTIASQVQIPGFRKGKVPPRIIDQRFGRAVVLQEAVSEAVPRFYSRAVEQSALRPLGQPEVEVDEVPDPASGGELKFHAEIDVRPTLTLPDLSGIAVTVDDVEVSEDEVEERLTALRQRFGTLHDVQRPAAAGDFVSLDISAVADDGTQIESAQGISYEIGSGTMLPGLDEAVTGAELGQTVTFRAPLVAGERAGEEVELTVVVQSVKERELPDADDEFAELASEFDSLEELREDLRSQVRRSAAVGQGIQARDRVMERLLEIVDVPVPEAVVDAEVQRHLDEEHADGQVTEEHRAEFTEQTRSSLRTTLLLDAIAESAELQVSQPELVEYLMAQAQQYGMDAGEFAQAVDKAGQVQAMVSEVVRRKALAFAMSKASVTDASGNPVDLEALAAPDAAEDEAEEAEGAAEEDMGDTEHADGEAASADQNARPQAAPVDLASRL